MKLINKIVFLLILVFSSFLINLQEILFVSTGGTGSAYSKEQPGNIEGLTSKLREVRSKQPGNINIFFNGGEYLLNQPLGITNRESGTKKDALILMGIKGEKVIVSGGRKVIKWEKSVKGIFRAKVPACTDFRQLYVNGKIAVRARTPNRENDNDFDPYYRGLGFDLKNQTIKVNATEIPKWNNRDNVELVFNQHWYLSRVRIESVKTAYITPMLPARKHFFQLNASMLKPGKPYYFENALGFLDQGGEWYLDKVENVLYYMPVQGDDLQKMEVIYPVLETIIKVSGEAAKPAFNPTLKNLRLAYTNWTTPGRDGLIATQAVQGRGYSALDDRGIIEARFADNLSVTNCELVGTGFHGIVFSTGVKNESGVRGKAGLLQ